MVAETGLRALAGPSADLFLHLGQAANEAPVTGQYWRTRLNRLKELPQALLLLARRDRLCLVIHTSVPTKAF